MSNDFMTPRRRRWPIAVLGLSVVLVLLAALMVVLGVVVPHTGSTVAGNTRSRATAAPPATAARSGPSANPVATMAGPLHLIRGTQMVNGVSVGYPHTLVGAVSAAVEFYTQIGSNLDPDRGVALGMVIAVTGWANAPQQFAQAATNARQGFGMPSTGALPPGYATVLDPVQYQAREVTPDRMTVLLLSYLMITTPGGGTVTHQGVWPILMAWDSTGDWKWSNNGKNTIDYKALETLPGSPRAAALGWLDMTR